MKYAVIKKVGVIVYDSKKEAEEYAGLMNKFVGAIGDRPVYTVEEVKE